MGAADLVVMPMFARHLLPIVEARRRPNHRPGGSNQRPGRALAQEPVFAVHAPTFEPSSPARALAIVALSVVRKSRRPDARPASWTAPAFERDVDLIRLHLAPIRSRPVLAASFGREAFHGDMTGTVGVAVPVTVAYAIRWLELGDGLERPRWAAWLAESAPRPRASAAMASTGGATD